MAFRTQPEDVSATHHGVRDVRTLLREFISEALRLHAYADVVWAATHYEVQHPSDALVELCATIAYVCLGDNDHALRYARSVVAQPRDIVTLTKALKHILGHQRSVALRMETADALIQSIQLLPLVASRLTAPKH